MKYERILEGSCPTCDTPLERRESCGWCPTCNVGHALTMKPDGTGTYSLTIEPKMARMRTSSPSSPRITGEITSMRFTRELEP